MFLHSHFNGPIYKGRSLGEWITIHAFRHAKDTSAAERDQAAEAIRAIGTNALPSLLKWGDHQPGSWRLAIEPQLKKLPQWLVQSVPVQSLFYKQYERAANAMIAFEALGPIGAPAIPELHRLICRTNSPGPNEGALLALSSIGAAAVPAVTNVLANTKFAGDPLMLWCLLRLGTNATAVAPVLLTNLRHADARIASMSANFLGVLRFDPEHAVPALSVGLSDSSLIVRAESARALGAYGSIATNALPGMNTLLNDPEPLVRTAAAEAIKAITAGTHE